MHHVPIETLKPWKKKPLLIQCLIFIIHQVLEKYSTSEIITIACRLAII